jgi:hypothetical protein
MSHLKASEQEKPMSVRCERIRDAVMGIDWGYGDVSYSVVTIGGWNQHNDFEIIYTKKYRLGEEVNPEYQFRDVLNLFAQFNCLIMGVDYGAGWGQNARLKARLGNRCVEFIYSHGQKNLLKYSQIAGRYTMNRTESMSQLFEAFKAGRIKTFQSHSENFGNDYMNISATQDSLGRVLYQHSPSKPDDVVHSANYAFTVARIMRKELNPILEQEPKQRR